MIWTIKYIDYPWGSSTASHPRFKLHDTPLLWKCVQSRLHHYLGSFPLSAIAPSFPSWLAAFISLSLFSLSFPLFEVLQKICRNPEITGSLFISAILRAPTLPLSSDSTPAFPPLSHLPHSPLLNGHFCLHFLRYKLLGLEMHLLYLLPHTN